MNLGTSSKGTEVWLEIPIQLLILFCPKTKRTLERNRISVFKTRKGGRLWMQSSTKNKKKNTTCQSVQTVTENEEGIHVFGLKLPIIQNKVQPQVFHWKAEFVIVLSSFLPFFLHGSPPTPPPPSTELSKSVPGNSDLWVFTLCGNGQILYQLRPKVWLKKWTHLTVTFPC